MVFVPQIDKPSGHSIDGVYVPNFKKLPSNNTPSPQDKLAHIKTPQNNDANSLKDWVYIPTTAREPGVSEHTLEKIKLATDYRDACDSVAESKQKLLDTAKTSAFQFSALGALASHALSKLPLGSGGQLVSTTLLMACTASVLAQTGADLQQLAIAFNKRERSKEVLSKTVLSSNKKDHDLQLLSLEFSSKKITEDDIENLGTGGRFNEMISPKLRPIPVVKRQAPVIS